MHIVSTRLFIKLAIPDWVPGFTQEIRNNRLAFDELQVTSHNT